MASNSNMPPNNTSDESDKIKQLTNTIKGLLEQHNTQMQSAHTYMPTYTHTMHTHRDAHTCTLHTYIMYKATQTHTDMPHQLLR